MRVLVSGWFSFEQMGATAGDLYAKDIVCQWLEQAGVPYDIAYDEPFQGGVKWNMTDPATYSHVIFVCGPFGNGWPVADFLDHFAGIKLIGINLSMLQALEEWNPFDLLLERDSTRKQNPDLVFLSEKSRVPVVGKILIEPQKEYGSKAKHQLANEMIAALLAKQRCAVVPIDTRLDVPNKGGLRFPEEIESLINHMDLVVTTRLHGLVLALKNGVPALAVDAISGGAKITKQAQTVQWPNAFMIDELTAQQLQEGFEYCLTNEAREKALQCKESAMQSLHRHKQTLIDFLTG
jgi:hypothetical protein